MKFIGMGTGRCGTLTLAKMINHCKGVSWSHEEYLIPFSGKGKRTIINSIKHDGDISLTWTFHWQTLKKFYPDIKIIILKRNKKDTVKSFIKWEKTHPIFIRDWMKNIPDINTILGNQEFDKQKYFENYYDYCFNIYKTVPNAFSLWTRELNSYKKFIKLCDFLEIPKKNILFKKIHTHKS